MSVALKMCKWSYANSRKKAYQDAFQKWQLHWEWCISAGREYFEGNKAHSVADMSEKIIKK
jgi:hypothetical protein